MTTPSAAWCARAVAPEARRRAAGRPFGNPERHQHAVRQLNPSIYTQINEHRPPAMRSSCTPASMPCADASPPRTLLGSCVSITLWHPARRIGAMSHFLLAEPGQEGARALDGRYGDEALELMLADAAAWASRRRMPGQASSAAAICSPRRSLGEQRGVGETNGEAARRLLQQHRHSPRCRSLFGDRPPAIVFDIRNGEVSGAAGQAS
jgi:chemotaxis protein CheD